MSGHSRGSANRFHSTQPKNRDSNRSYYKLQPFPPPTPQRTVISTEAAHAFVSSEAEKSAFSTAPSHPNNRVPHLRRAFSA
jgi:hypothetical protein